MPVDWEVLPPREKEKGGSAVPCRARTTLCRQQLQYVTLYREREREREYMDDTATGGRPKSVFFLYFIFLGSN